MFLEEIVPTYKSSVKNAERAISVVITDNGSILLEIISHDAKYTSFNAGGLSLLYSVLFIIPSLRCS